MLADDEPHIRMLFRSVIASMGAEVIAEATNGEEAVKLHEQLNPDITLLDINMPRMDGSHALKKILAQDPDAIVIMLTSLTNMAIVKELIGVGASNYIRKDTPIKEIKSLIKKTWSGHQNPVIERAGK